MSETTRMRAPYFELQMGAGPSLLLDELRIQRERNEAQHAELAGLRAEMKQLSREADFYRQRCELLQRWQSAMRDPERTVVCDILANGQTLPPGVAGDRYGSMKPAPNAPRLDCHHCHGTGEIDSGGSQPWGEAIFVECGCSAATAPEGARHD